VVNTSQLKVHLWAWKKKALRTRWWWWWWWWHTQLLLRDKQRYEISGCEFWGNCLVV